MREKKAIKFILPAVIILAGFFSYFLNYDRILLFDWGFFNSFGHLLKSAVLEYHRFPVHDPWVCGGVDILSRPQNWVFSAFHNHDSLASALYSQPAFAHHYELYRFLGDVQAAAILRSLGHGKYLLRASVHQFELVRPSILRRAT